jgi:hypothetical protein
LSRKVSAPESPNGGGREREKKERRGLPLVNCPFLTAAYIPVGQRFKLGVGKKGGFSRHDLSLTHSISLVPSVGDERETSKERKEG